MSHQDEERDDRSRAVPEEAAGRPPGGEAADRVDDPDGQESSTSTALSLIESGREGSNAVSELLRAMSQLMRTLDTERRDLLVAEERRREAEVENARLLAQVEGERELRRRSEDELDRMRAEVDDRRKRAQATLEKITGKVESPASHEARPETREANAAAPAPPPMVPAGDSGAAAHIGPEGSPTRARGPAPAPTGPETPTGPGTPIAPPHEPAAATPNGPDARVSPAPPPGSRHPSAALSASRSTAQDKPQPTQESPLPPGWRYASDLPPESRRWRWPWGRHSRPSS